MRPIDLAEFLAGRHVPDPNCLVPASGDHLLLVGRKKSMRCCAFVAAEDAELAAVLRPPNAGRAVAAGREDVTIAHRPDDAIHGRRVPLDAAHHLAGWRVPQADGKVAAGRPLAVVVLAPAA